MALGETVEGFLDIKLSVPESRFTNYPPAPHKQGAEVVAVTTHPSTIDQEISNEFENEKAEIVADRRPLLARVPRILGSIPVCAGETKLALGERVQRGMDCSLCMKCSVLLIGSHINENEFLPRFHERGQVGGVDGRNGRHARRTPERSLGPFPIFRGTERDGGRVSPG